MRKQITVIAPHSDDAELGVGGYLHREAKKGAVIKVFVLAGGSYSSTLTKQPVGATKRQQRLTQFIIAHRRDLGLQPRLISRIRLLDWHWRGRLCNDNRLLDQTQLGDGAIAEMTVDPLDDQRLQMLQLQR